MKKICLLSDHHLCVNPRLWKEAFFYEQEGFEVVIITMWQSADLLKKDTDLLSGHQIQYKAFLNMIPGEINSLHRFFYRLRKRVAAELQRYLKIGTGWAISFAPERLFKKALAEGADLNAAHLECGFFVGRKLVMAGRKVSFDFEDWYSRDYLTATRAVGLLTSLEEYALRNGLFCTAASESMATALKLSISEEKKITIIYNSFPIEKFVMKRDAEIGNKPFRLLWTSRTVGPNRGLETLMEATKELKSPVELHLIGHCKGGYEEKLRSIWPANVKHKLVFYEFMNHNELMKLISTFHLGLAIENKEPDNKNKTISNKILQYLQSGIKVLATDTDGHKEVAEYFPDSVFIVPVGKPELWKEQLEKIIDKRNITFKEEQLKEFENIFSWRKQEDKLRQLISAIN